MNKQTDPRSNKEKDEKIVSNEHRSPEEIKQQQTDPNITELKGFIDPDEELEPRGTDNDV